jgi:hypothetical protein
VSVAFEHLAFASDLLQTLAVDFANNGSHDRAAQALQTWLGVRVTRREGPARLSEDDAIALDHAHGVYSGLLPNAFRGEAPLVHVAGVLAALENVFAAETPTPARQSRSS